MIFGKHGRWCFVLAREEAQGSVIQGVFRFRRIAGFYINAARRVFLQDPVGVFPLRSFEVVFMCWIAFVDLSSDDNIWLVHINGK